MESMYKETGIPMDWDSYKKMSSRQGPGYFAAPYKMERKEYLEFVAKTFADMLKLIEKKNTDYTAGGGPFANFEQSQDIGIKPIAGLVLRISDKYQRIKSFIKRGKLEGEGVEDAFLDLIGYSCLALGMIEENKRDSSNTNYTPALGEIEPVVFGNSSAEERSSVGAID